MKVKSLFSALVLGGLFLTQGQASANQVSFFDGMPNNGTAIRTAPSGAYVLYKTEDRTGVDYSIYYPAYNQHAKLFRVISEDTFKVCGPGSGVGIVNCRSFQRNIKTDLNDSLFETFVTREGYHRFKYPRTVNALLEITDLKTNKVETKSEAFRIHEYNACLSIAQKQNETSVINYRRGPEIADRECRVNYGQGTISRVDIGSEYVSPFQLDELATEKDRIRLGTGLLQSDGDTDGVYLARNAGSVRRSFPMSRVFFTRMSSKVVRIHVGQAGRGLKDLNLTDINLPENFFDVSLYTSFGAESINAVFRLESGKYLHVLIADNQSLKNLAKTFGLKVVGNLAVQPYRSQGDLKGSGACSLLLNFDSRCKSNEKL